MDVRITPGSYVDKGNALKITHYEDGRNEIEPVYARGCRYKIVALTNEVAALIEIKEGSGVGTMWDMLDTRKIQGMPQGVPSSLRNWLRKDEHEADFFERVRSLSQVETNKGILKIYYTTMMDGEFDEQVHRHRTRASWPTEV